MNNYLVRNWPVLAGGFAVGVAYALYAALAARSFEVVLGVFIGTTILARPFGLRSGIARLWTAAWLLTIAGVIGGRVDHLHSPVGYVMVTLAGLAFGIAVLLRWRPPAESAAD